MRYECLNAFSELHHLVDVAEDHILGGGVDEAAGVNNNVRLLGKGEPGASTSCVEVLISSPGVLCELWLGSLMSAPLI